MSVSLATKEVSRKFIPFSDLRALSESLRQDGKRVVFTTGTFDILNPGHCRYLAEAKSRGDILVVGVATDASEKRLKGSNFPLLPEQFRAELLTYLRVVDYVTIVDHDRPYSALVLLRPDVFYTCERDWELGVRASQDTLIVQTYGGEIYRDQVYEPYFSVRDLVDRIAHIRFMQILKHYLADNLDVFLEASPVLKPVSFGRQLPRFKDAFNARDLFLPSSRLSLFRAEASAGSQKIVFVAGTFDILHVGHVRFIEQASKHGDLVVIGVPSDAVVTASKGEGRPVISEDARAYVLASLGLVDRVVIFQEPTVLETLRALQPDVFYTVNDSWNSGYKESPEYALVISYGGQVIRGDKQSSRISVSKIINAVAYNKVLDIFKDCMAEDFYNSVSNEESRLK